MTVHDQIILPLSSWRQQEAVCQWFHCGVFRFLAFHISSGIFRRLSQSLPVWKSNFLHWSCWLISLWCSGQHRCSLGNASGRCLKVVGSSSCRADIFQESNSLELDWMDLNLFHEGRYASNRKFHLLSKLLQVRDLTGSSSWAAERGEEETKSEKTVRNRKREKFDETDPKAALGPGC